MTHFSRDDFKRLIAELQALAAEYDTPAQAELINRATTALEDFTTGRKPTLDHAFGLVECRGKRGSQEKFALACDAYRLKYREAGNPTWNDIAAKLDTIHKFDLDGPGLKVLVSRHKAEIQLHFFKIEIDAAMND